MTDGNKPTTQPERPSMWPFVIALAVSLIALGAVLIDMMPKP